MDTEKVIDYDLLGRVLSDYINWDYKYVEAPWTVHEEAIRATLPSFCKPITVNNLEPSFLVGSAEQSLLFQNLPQDVPLVACTPCFRFETETYYHKPYFMKIELFCRTERREFVNYFKKDARMILQRYTTKTIEVVSTEEGYDLEIDGIEIGSYGFREHEKYGSWCYGTGLALPRFSQVR